MAVRTTRPAEAATRGTLYVNRCPSTPGHVVMCDATGERIDSAAGPREMMTRIYAVSGWTVVDSLPAD